jgi:phage terminase large subunit
VSTGRYTQTGKKMWVEKEYYWDPKKKGRQKINSEFAEDVQQLLEPYSIKTIYIDPSAEAFQLELRRKGMHVVHANNDVENGIQLTTNEMKKGNLFILSECTNTIREIEGYVWDSKAADRGWDEPLKKDDHSVDALRYALASHKVSVYDPYKEERASKDYMQNRFTSRF